MTAHWGHSLDSEVDWPTAMRTISGRGWGDVQANGDFIEIQLTSSGQEHRDTIKMLLEKAGCPLTQSINT